MKCLSVLLKNIIFNIIYLRLIMYKDQVLLNILINASLM